MMVTLETVLKTCPLHSVFLKGIRWPGQSSQNFIASDGCEALWESDGAGSAAGAAWVRTASAAVMMATLNFILA